MKTPLILASLVTAAVLAACSSPPAPIAPEDASAQPTLEELNADNDSSVELTGSKGGLGNLLVRKIYDTNQNGRRDEDEPGIPDWGVRIVSVDENGNPDDAADIRVTPHGPQRWRGVNLRVPFGRYKIEELEPTGTKQPGVKWKVTGSAARIVNVSRERPVRALEFAGVCLENGAVVNFPRLANFADWKCRATFDLLPRIASFTAMPAQIQAGGSSVLAWNVLDSSRLEITPTVGVVTGFTGSKNVAPSSTTAYTLKATNGFGSRMASVSVNVGSVASLPGSLDASFGSGGEVRTDGPVPGFVNPVLPVVVIVAQPDGKIIVGGSESDGVTVGVRQVTNFLLRYNADGSLDTGFGSAGRVLFGPFDPDIFDFEVGLRLQQLVLLPSGKILAFGASRDSDPFGPTRDAVHQLVVFRFNTNGTLDTSFGSDGRRSYDVANRDLLPSNILVQPDGKILIGSQFGSLVRYTQNGDLDATFGINGRVDKDPNADLGVLGSGSGQLQSDGKILVAATLVVGTRPIAPDAVTYIQDVVLRRYTANGSVDTAFGNQGRLVVDLGGEKDSVQNLLLRVDGTLGNLGQNNFVPTAIRAPEAISFGFPIQPGGKIVTVTPIFGPSSVRVARYGGDGRLDLGFGSQGELQLPVRDSVFVDFFYDARTTFGRDGKIVTVVWNGLANTIYLYRINP
jgi:uncharacterized delta-60 repeat protein